MKKIIIRGLCLALVIALLGMLSLGVLDYLVLGVIVFAVLVLACLATIIHNQK